MAWPIIQGAFNFSYLGVAAYQINLTRLENDFASYKKVKDISKIFTGLNIAYGVGLAYKGLYRLLGERTVTRLLHQDPRCLFTPPILFMFAFFATYFIGTLILKRRYDLTKVKEKNTNVDINNLDSCLPIRDLDFPYVNNLRVSYSYPNKVIIQITVLALPILINLGILYYTVYKLHQSLCLITASLIVLQAISLINLLRQKWIKLDLTLHAPNGIGQIRSLRSAKFSNFFRLFLAEKKKEKEEPCPVCFDEDDKDDQFYFCENKHAFHEACILGWMLNKAPNIVNNVSFQRRVTYTNNGTRISYCTNIQEEQLPNCPQCRQSYENELEVDISEIRSWFSIPSVVQMRLREQS